MDKKEMEFQRVLFGPYHSQAEADKALADFLNREFGDMGFDFIPTVTEENHEKGNRAQRRANKRRKR